MIIWYDPSVSSSAQVRSITSFFQDPANETKVIVAPYDYPDQGSASQLPNGEQMAVVAWHHLQTCSKPSLAVAFDFVAHYRAPPFQGESYKGDAPEPQVAI